MVSGPAIAIGKFDALHRGHRALVDAAAGLGDPLLLSFTGMAAVLGWSPRLPLVPAEARPAVLRGWQDELGCAVSWNELDFAAVRALDATAFLDLLVRRWAPRALVCGPDFRFGRNRLAGVDELRRTAAARAIAVGVVPPLRVDGRPVSSSRIRATLAGGDVAAVAAMLGRPYRLYGTVVRGDARGHDLGFPTANCGDLRNCEPGTGIYACWAHLDGHGAWPAAVSIGHNPTIAPDRPLAVEAHLLDFDRSCYGAGLQLDFVARLRDQIRYRDLDQLIAQIGHDVDRVRALLGSPAAPSD